jgi:hypothetical protein
MDRKDALDVTEASITPPETETLGALALAPVLSAEPDPGQHVTREQRRSRRKRDVRARTISVKRMTKREL